MWGHFSYSFPVGSDGAEFTLYTEIEDCSTQDLDTSLNETDLFPAVRLNNIKKIEEYIKNGNINAVDTCKRTALQAALCRMALTVESCFVLIQSGINLENQDDNGDTALANIVYFYRDSAFKLFEDHPQNQLKLFHCLVQGGAYLNLEKRNRGSKDIINIREKIRSHPEMEAIVQEVNIKRANHIFAALKGEFQITRLVCEMLDLDPGGEWRPF